jgi:hypothetical protein
MLQVHLYMEHFQCLFRSLSFVYIWGVGSKKPIISPFILNQASPSSGTCILIIFS